MAGTNYFTKYDATVYIALTDQYGNGALISCEAADLPTGAGFAVGCIAFATDTGVLYTNTGTTSAATFTAVDSSTSFVLPDAFSDAVTDTGTSFQITANAVTTGNVQKLIANGLTTGAGLNITSTGTIITTGALISLTANSATTATGLITLSATGLTDGFMMALTGGGANVTASGGGINLSLGAATAGTGIKITTTGVYTGTTGMLAIVADSATTGVLAKISGNGLTTGTGMLITSTGTMTTTGNLLTLTANSATTAAGILRVNANALTSGIGVVIASSATAITGAGRLLYVTHTGATGTSATLTEFASAATDETVIAKVTASNALAAGKALAISGVLVSTGTLLDISDNTAHTTGKAVNVVTNSADTGTRSLVYIKQDHASASGATPLELANDGALALIKGTAAATDGHYFPFAVVNDVTIWIGDGTTADGTLSGTAGDILFNGGSNKPEYCTGTTNWTALA